jgi:ribosome-associated protein YbcJ (S4-like RNA binding protein)
MNQRDSKIEQRRAKKLKDQRQRVDVFDIFCSMTENNEINIREGDRISI